MCTRRCASYSPRRLQAQVGNRLDTLGLKAALAELKSYRDPPKAVLQVVTAVLCLLGLGRLSSLSAWQFVRPQLKPSLPKGMLQFDAARAVTDETPWEESARASAGLTSDEVWKKGSLASHDVEMVGGDAANEEGGGAGGGRKAGRWSEYIPCCVDRAYFLTLGLKFNHSFPLYLLHVGDHSFSAGGHAKHGRQLDAHAEVARRGRNGLEKGA